MKATTHWDALAELVDHLIRAGEIAADEKEEILAALHEREDQVSTGIGSGVAIPHAYCRNLRDTMVVFGRSPGGIEFEALDNAPVHFVILLLVPEDQGSTHLQTLASIAGLFSRSEVRKGLAGIEGAEQLLEAIRQFESKAA
ncbi:MAG: PTS sugar transporter subunit IIA [Akkermansiaceae bacterium]|nr:PTS sugar transporter subunit IIA [Akkermansiaceae bacterium]NNM31090.1 PTS sugar transporter subunit IIA [Akkermansiaceae bacterium]